MALAIFDLDNTLLAGDSDHLWGEFLAAEGAVDPDRHRRENDRFHRDYLAGRLDIHAFLRFAFRPLAELPRSRLDALRERFIADHIEPIVLPAGRTLIDRHRGAGDSLLIVTATNSFVTAPIAELLGIEHLIATEPETDAEGIFTGRVAGTPAFREGKIVRLDHWLAEQGASLTGSHFYSDSRNDLPLLERVAHPVAVDPDATLAGHARDRGWPRLTLRQGDHPRALE